MNTRLSVPIGITQLEFPYVLDITEAKHVLIGGTTGSGKSNLIHVIINALMLQNSPEELKFVLMDPKLVELTLYEGAPHLLESVVTSSDGCVRALKHVLDELDNRLTLDTESLTKKPTIVIIIDELSDFMSSNPNEVEEALVRIAKHGHTVGIHLIISTSRPSEDVYTNSIREVIPTRIAGNTASENDSYTILNETGAEKLLGKGDMLICSEGKYQPIRFQAYSLPEV